MSSSKDKTSKAGSKDKTSKAGSKDTKKDTRGEIDDTNKLPDGATRERKRTAPYVLYPCRNDKEIRDEIRKNKKKDVGPLHLVTPSHVPPSPPPLSSRWGSASRVGKDCPGCALLPAMGARCDACMGAQNHNPKARKDSRSVVPDTAMVDANPGSGSGAAAPPSINPFGSFGEAITALGRCAVEAVSGLQANLQDKALALQTALDASLLDSDPKTLDDVIDGSDSDDSRLNLDEDEKEHRKLDERYGDDYRMQTQDLDAIKAKIDALENFEMFFTLTVEQREEMERLKDLHEAGKASLDFVVSDDSPRLKEKGSKADWDNNGLMSKTMVRGPGGPRVAKKSSKNPDKVLLPSRSLGKRNAPSPPPRHRNPYKVPERYRPTLSKEGPAPSTYFNPFTPLHSKDPRKWVLTVSDRGNFEGQDDFEVRCENRADNWKLEVVHGVTGDEQTWVCDEDLVFTIDEITGVVMDEAENTKITQEEIESMRSRLQAVGIEVSGGVIGLPEDEEGPEEISNLFLRIPVPSTGFYMQHYKVPEDEDADDEQADEMGEVEDADDEQATAQGGNGVPQGGAADDAETDYLDLRFSLYVSDIVNDAVWIREVVDGSQHDSDSDHGGSEYSREAALSRSEGSADGDGSGIDSWDHSDSENEFQAYDQLIPDTDPPVYINADGYDAAGNYHPGAFGWHPAPNNGAAAQGGHGVPQGGAADEEGAPQGPMVGD